MGRFGVESLGRLHALKRGVVSSTLGLALAGLVSAKAQTVQYAVTDLGANLSGSALSASGNAAVGSAILPDGSTGFYWTNGVLSTPTIAEAPINNLSAISADGAAYAGIFWGGAFGMDNPFVVSAGVVSDVGAALPDPFLAEVTTANNTSVFGFFIADDFTTIYPYRYNFVTHQATVFPSPGEAEIMHANTNNVSVGYEIIGGDSIYHACVWQADGTAQELGVTGVANGNSNTGLVVGQRTDVNPWAAFASSASGSTVSTLPALHAGDPAAAYAASDTGIIVGLSGASACLWVDGSATNLNNLISSTNHCTLASAISISTDGTKILCNGSDTVGTPHAYLLTFLGTQPVGKTTTNALFPNILSAVVKDGKINISYAAVVGNVYQPQYTASVARGAWQSLGSQQTATNTVMSFADATTNASRFYRVEAPAQ